MSKKERRIQKQKEREEKFREKEKTGKARRITYEPKEKKTSQPNRKSDNKTPEEEMAERQEKAERATVVYRQMLPELLKKLSKIEDPRQPNKVKHQITVLMAYGILSFVYQVGSRRKINKQMTKPVLWENLTAMFPELKSLPHVDTLARVLEIIDVEKVQDALIGLLKDLMRKKKFKNQLRNNKYLVAVDGTQKFFRNYQWESEALKRTVGGEVRVPQYYVYVLDSVMVLDNRIVIPVISEILENKDWIEGETKQDCEQKALKRLAPKLYKIFGKGNVILLGDGLYSCGQVIRICRKYTWDFMLVLKEDGNKSIWREATGLMRLEPNNQLRVKWGDRNQIYQWANDIEYDYGPNLRYTELVHAVICTETWIEKNSRSTRKEEIRETRYAWISSKKLNENNVFNRCTKIGRYRWKIENNFLIEKHEGYCFEHCYSYTWQVMKGFHYLMKVGHFLNALALGSELLVDYVKRYGIRGFLHDLLQALSRSVLDLERIKAIVHSNHYWRLKAS
jgi:hypothetical protein